MSWKGQRIQDGVVHGCVGGAGRAGQSHPCAGDEPGAAAGHVTDVLQLAWKWASTFSRTIFRVSTDCLFVLYCVCCVVFCCVVCIAACVCKRELASWDTEGILGTLGPDGGFRPTGVLVQRWVQNQLQRGAEHPPLRARAAGKNAAFELLEADFKAFVSEINLGVDLTWY